MYSYIIPYTKVEFHRIGRRAGGNKRGRLLKPAPGWPSGTNGIKKKYISIKKKRKEKNTVHKMLNAGGE